MGKEKDHSIIWVICGLIAIMIVSVAGWGYYTDTLRETGLNDLENLKEYDRHYVLITDNVNSTFWESVYQSASKRAEEENALIEFMGVDAASGNSVADLLRMSIAQAVDGILIEYTADPEVDILMERALEQSIPVITVSNDNPQSQRQSFVGVSSFQLGEAYSEQVVSLLTEQTKRVMILTKSNVDEANEKQISVQITNAVAKEKLGKNVRVEVKNVSPQTAFDSEEAIRDVFQQKEGPPDILVCLDEVDTECADQAVIDYNQVGDVRVVGYYATQTILEGIEKGILSSTIEVDAEQMGENAIDALTEYQNEGRVSDYYSVDVNIIQKENVEAYLEQYEK